MNGDISISSMPSDFEEKLTSLLDNVLIDDQGRWKAQLSHQILQLAGLRAKDHHPHFIVGEDSQESPPRSRSNSVKTTETQTEEVMISHGKPPESSEKGDEEILRKLEAGVLKHRMLEEKVPNKQAVSIRRNFIESQIRRPLAGMPYADYDYTLVNGACCENIIGYIPIPVGIAGPLMVNGRSYYIPLATTEGALVASTNRGCSAVMSAAKRLQEGGIFSAVTKDGMTRAPVVSFERVRDVLKVKKWVEENSDVIKEEFEKTSRFAKLSRIDPTIAGTSLHLRFVADTGDAMGMNMVSKASNAAMKYIMKKIAENFPTMKVEYKSLSGNMCVDKKASAINWIEGRGKSVVAEATIPDDVVRSVLKTSVDALVSLAKEKLLVGSSMAGTIGGWNAHAANIVAAMFLATGQDAAQVVSSSMCYTEMKKTETGDLHISCTMNCLEVGTVGGGTILEPQKTVLKMLDCCGSGKIAGENSKRLAEIICATVLAGELSLMASQCTDDLVRSHLKLNRSCFNLGQQQPELRVETPHMSESVADFRHIPSTTSPNTAHLGIYDHSPLTHGQHNQNHGQKSQTKHLKVFEKEFKEKAKANCQNIL